MSQFAIRPGQSLETIGALPLQFKVGQDLTVKLKDERTQQLVNGSPLMRQSLDAMVGAFNRQLQQTPGVNVQVTLGSYVAPVWDRIFDIITSPSPVPPAPPPPAPIAPKVESCLSFELLAVTSQGVQASERFSYLELSQVADGHSIQFINLSNDPAATFNTATPRSLTVTGRDASRGRVAVALGQVQMHQLGIEAGDVLQVRTVDRQGQASPAVTVKLDPNSWAKSLLAEQHTRIEVNDQRVVSSGVTREFYSVELERSETLRPVGFLDTLTITGGRQNLFIGAISDRRLPKLAAEKLSLTASEGGLRLVGENCLEPGATLRVLNENTGEIREMVVGDSRKIELPLGAVAEPTRFVLLALDAEGNPSAPHELTYQPGGAPVATTCKAGLGPAVQALLRR